MYSYITAIIVIDIKALKQGSTVAPSSNTGKMSAIKFSSKAYKHYLLYSNYTCFQISLSSGPEH